MIPYVDLLLFFFALVKRHHSASPHHPSPRYHEACAAALHHHPLVNITAMSQVHLAFSCTTWSLYLKPSCSSIERPAAESLLPQAAAIPLADQSTGGQQALAETERLYWLGTNEKA
jgi:hypothetical protein